MRRRLHDRRTELHDPGVRVWVAREVAAPECIAVELREGAEARACDAGSGGLGAEGRVTEREHEPAARAALVDDEVQRPMVPPSM